MFMECRDLKRSPCAECQGTGIRGAKRSGKKKCHTCEGRGYVFVCESKEPPCMYCPRHFNKENANA